MADPGQDAICAHAGLQNQQMNPGRGSTAGSTGPWAPCCGLLASRLRAGQEGGLTARPEPPFVQGSSFTSVASSVSTTGL